MGWAGKSAGLADPAQTMSFCHPARRAGLKECHALFQTPLFHHVNHLRDLPDTRAEVAFVGAQRRQPAPSTPWPTAPGWLMSRKPRPHPAHQFFDLGHERFLVDLPGYGYAEVPEAVRAHWVELLGAIWASAAR